MISPNWRKTDHLRGNLGICQILSYKKCAIAALLPTYSAQSMEPRSQSTLHSTSVCLSCGGLPVNPVRTKCLVVSGYSQIYGGTWLNIYNTPMFSAQMKNQAIMYMTHFSGEQRDTRQTLLLSVFHLGCCGHRLLVEAGY